MIRSCKDRETEKLFRRIPSRRFQQLEKAARIKLGFLDAAATLDDLTLPGLRLEKLAGDRTGQYSIRVNQQYRICFRWKNGDAYEVEVTDYH
ncbi:MAG: type II toxin-antitoxin system RelE/ParE family toxin [Acidobacteriota bacterium]